MAKKKTAAKKTKQVKASGVRVYCSHTKIVPIESVVPNPKNPYHHPEGQVALLALIINGNGWRNPIVVSQRSGFIVKGHCRLLAARHAGWTEVPVDEQEYENEALEHADLMADNRIAELAEVDRGELKELMESVQLGEIDTVMTGFVESEITAMLSNADIDPEVYEDLDEQAATLSGKAPNQITIEVPLEHVEKVARWLAHGEKITAPGMGKGVMKRCGLL